MKIIRVGNYTTGFKYYKNKVEITNSDEIDKIKLLKIPPAYENVTIVNILLGGWEWFSERD